MRLLRKKFVRSYLAIVQGGRYQRLGVWGAVGGDLKLYRFGFKKKSKNTFV